MAVGNERMFFRHNHLLAIHNKHMVQSSDFTAFLMNCVGRLDSIVGYL